MRVSADSLSSPTVGTGRRPGLAGVVAKLTAHGLQSFFRSPVSAFFTLGFPLLFLFVTGAAQGDQLLAGTDIPMTQFLVAPFAAFGVAEAAFCVLAIDAAVLRDQGVLKRLGATPAPPWTMVAARVIVAVAVSLLSAAVLLAVGVAVFGVEPVWRMVPAAAVILGVGIACFAALGLALVSVTRSVLAAQTLTNGLLIPVAFVSEIFIVGVRLPPWLDWLGSALPLKHLVRALAVTFDPRATGSGFSSGHLAVLVGWGLVGTAVAWRGTGARSWTHSGASSRLMPGAPSSEPLNGGRSATGPVVLSRPTHSRPVAWTLMAGQARHVLTQMRRDPLSAFFIAVFPLMLLMLFSTVFGDVMVNGVPLEQMLLAAMVTFTVANVGYVFLPEMLVQARARGVLKRLRGTPLPPAAYFAGRAAAALAVAAGATLLMGVAAVAVLDVPINLRRLPAAAVTVALGVLCFAALGAALVAALPTARSSIAITLGTLMPLGFVSEVFVFGAQLPDWLVTVGNLFPLRHIMLAFRSALESGGGSGFAWGHLAVVTVWTVVGLALARRLVRQSGQ